MDVSYAYYGIPLTVAAIAWGYDTWRSNRRLRRELACAHARAAELQARVQRTMGEVTVRSISRAGAQQGEDEAETPARGSMH